MCGINALYKYTEVTASDKEKLSLMNQEMHYRGPDDSGVWNDKKCGLAHVRLSIIGLDNGHQPLFNEDKSLFLICNGEIYNYIELKKELKEKGHRFTSDSDSEVIIHLYEEKKEKCIEYLRGMFAFTLWDKKRKRLFAARDRAGQKPLYYAEIPCGVVFSSELKAINKFFVEAAQIDFNIINDEIRFSYPIDRVNTHIKQINRIEPGEYAFASDIGLRKENYWKKTNTYTFNATFEEAKKKTLDILRESVDIRLRSDVPVAVLLSGGIDSTAIAALAKECRKEVHAITVGYKGNPACDERDIAKKFAKDYGLIWHELELDEKVYEKYFDEYINYVDEPVADIAAIAQWGMYKKCKELGFTVLLSGNGGDELFYGYPQHNKTAEILDKVDKLKAFLPIKGKKAKIKFLKYLLLNFKDVIDLLNYNFTGPYLGKRFDLDFKKYLGDANIDFKCVSNNDEFFAEENKGIEKIYQQLFNVWLQANCYYLSDRLGMGNSLEIRAPFADHKLIEFVSSLPLHFKFNEKNPKYLLKEIINGKIPNYVIKGEKKGFTPPESFINKLIEKYQYTELNAGHKFFNSVFVDKIISKQRVSLCREYQFYI